MKNLLILSLFLNVSLFAKIENSIIPSLDYPQLKELEGKIHQEQGANINRAKKEHHRPLRIVSYNMLYNLPESEKNLEPIHRWDKRSPRLVEYLKEIGADIIGSQELLRNQLDFVMKELGNEYSYYGTGVEEGKSQLEIEAVIFRKARVKLLEGKTIAYKNVENPNAFTFCRFRSVDQEIEFIFVNTHLSFNDIKARAEEAKQLTLFIQELDPHIPLILTGNFNTFRFFADAEQPYYDGDYILSILEKAPIKDSMSLSLIGHFGPLYTTTYCQKMQKPFSVCKCGSPGLILDYIFVNREVIVLSQGIDPAKINGEFPSDHLPVIADIFLQSKKDLK